MEIIVLIIIISFLAVILFIALKKLVETINNDSREYYFQKIQEIDKKIDEKNKTIPDEKKTENKEIKNKSIVQKNELDENFLRILNNSDYQSINPLKISNDVDEIFRIDEEKIIKDFIKKLEVDENYLVYQKILDRFSPNLIYKLKVLSTDQQIKEIEKILSDDEYAIFKSYLDKKKFKLDKFLLDLSLLIDKSIPSVEVITGNRRKNYDYLSKYIKTVYSSDVYKGIIIKYQNQIYDYSINERDV